jgi:hypothetical protein
MDKKGKTPEQAGVIVPESFFGLRHVKDIGKQADGAKIQHGNNSYQCCLLSNLTNVKVFHEMEF